MKKKIYAILIFIILLSCTAYSKTIIVAKKVARIGNDIILESDVNRIVKMYNVSFETAKKYLIENTILFHGAKMACEEPTDEEIEKEIKNEKRNYAREIGVPVENISDEDFIKVLYSYNMSIKNYELEVKKQLWIKKFLLKKYEEVKNIKYFATDKEAEEFIKKNPDLFMEGEGVFLSMIYFSYYDKDSNLKSKLELKELETDSKLCLKKLMNGADFEEMVILYSNDLITKNETPKGKLGKIFFDDQRAIKKFGTEIINELKKSDAGIVKKVFETDNGLFIFKIDGFIEPDNISGKAAIIKAKDYLEKEYRKEEHAKLKENVINEIKNQLFIEEY